MLKKLLPTALLVVLLPFSWAVAQNNGTLTGTVTDSQTGEPLPGANVLIPELQRGTSTNASGEYELTNVEFGRYTITISFIGYQEYSNQVTIDEAEETFNIELDPSVAGMDELVVVGFGTQSRRNIVGSVSSVESESLTELHTTTVDKTLQGKTAGVQVTSTSGVLGAPVSVRVRGTTSINASSQPLYVIDGVPVVSNELGAGLGVSPNAEGGLNPLVNLDASDIASIEVLKDASAAAIYGSRGANGVVLITTKSGRAGKTSINVEYSTGISEPTKEYDILNAEQYIEMYNYANGASLNPENYANTDWADLVTRTGNVSNYRANVSGGNQQTQFYVSSSYTTEEGFSEPNSLDKFNARAKVNHSFNDRLDVNLSVSPSRSEHVRVYTSNAVNSPWTFAALASPLIPQYYPNGDINDGMNLNRAPANAFAPFPGTPYSNVEGEQVTATTTQIVADAGASYDFLPYLTFESSMSVQYLQHLEEGRSLTYATGGFPNGSGFASNDQFLNYSWRNTLTFSQDWENHAVNIVLGSTFQENEQTLIDVDGDTYLSDELQTLDNAANITGGGGFKTAYSFQNNLLRVSYDYKDRYLLTLTGSYNGSSRFGSDSQYGFFPAAALGWIITDEPFVDLESLSFLKLRASYGITGNAEINNFDQLALLGGGENYNNTPGVTLAQLASPQLSWEETAQFDIGLEYGFLDNRISGSLGYFNKKTTDLLLDVPVSNTNGFRDFTQNTGEVLNSGLEFEINADIIQQADLRWSINANISTLHNEVVDLPAGEFTNDENLVREGEAIGAFYVKEYKGVDPDNGDALYADGNGGTTSNFNAAPRKVLGTPYADYYGGFGTQVAYKGIDLNVDFQYSVGNYVYWADGAFMTTNMSSVWNQSSSQLDYWTPQNTDASVPEPRSVSNGSNSSSNGRYLEDASYLRLKNAEIGYSLPATLVSNYDIRIFAQGTNLLTFTDFPGLDPEVTPRSGANVTQGNVFFQLPQPRTLLLGVEFGI